ncbi:MAG: hypothetical protein AAFV53_03680 [Myxococcota bacterium]
MTPILLLLSALACRPNTPEPQPHMLPWNIARQADGSTVVFGLTPGRSTMADARERFGPNIEGALFDTKGALSLEVYFNQVTLSGITGKIILNLRATDDAMEHIRAASGEGKPTGAGAVRYEIANESADGMLRLTTRAFTFVPTADLDEAMLTSRFGQPAERLPQEAGELLLYPDKGLGILVQDPGRELLQYVHPDDIAWLRDQSRPEQ